MRNIDIKEVVNPFVLLPIITFSVFIIGLKGINVILSSFIAFFMFHFVSNLILVHKNVVKRSHYLWAYNELVTSLIFMIPLLYLIGVEQPILTSLFLVSVTDFLIQAYYNILPRKSGEDIVRLWRDRLIKSERAWFHPISLQKYTFKDFVTEIIEPGRINPTFSFICHHCLFSIRPRKSTIKHHYGSTSAIGFQILMTDEQIHKLSNLMYGGHRIPRQTDLVTDPTLIEKLKDIDSKSIKNIITAYMLPRRCRIVFTKKFVLNNPENVYDFLRKVVIKSN